MTAEVFHYLYCLAYMNSTYTNHYLTLVYSRGLLASDYFDSLLSKLTHTVIDR